MNVQPWLPKQPNHTMNAAAPQPCSVLGIPDGSVRILGEGP